MKVFLPIAFLFVFCFTAAAQVCPTNTSQPTILLAGDSWAEFMWTDGRYNQIFDKFGFNNERIIAKSLGSNPGAGHTGPEYAISGSTAREWADQVNYPWIANVNAEITANPTIKTVVLSIGGNDFLAGRPGGGWYQNMDNDVPGSELALFNQIKTNTLTIINGVQAVHPDVEFLITSYDYPNFSISGIACWIYACGKRRDLSFRDNILISDADLNQMMISIETFRINEIISQPKVYFDNAIGLMHYYYGDGNSAGGTLPYPVQTMPYGSNFYGGNPALPTIRSNFRFGFDPIHLDADAYEYKIINQTMSYFMPRFKVPTDVTIFSNGGQEDGWTDGSTSGTNVLRVGSSTAGSFSGIVSFDTGSMIPDGATIDKASLYIQRSGLSNQNPFDDAAVFGSPMIDVKTGTFGAVMVENSDATATADAVDVGCFHGTVSRNDYALRIDLNAAGLAAINTTGLTQFRIYFPNSSGGADFVAFKDGDATVDNNFATESLAEYMNDARPFLDVDFTPRIQVAATVFLEGPYDAASGLMATNLNNFGMIPLTEPYTALGLHNGTETTTSGVLATQPVVDWVLVELRDKNNSATVLESKAGLLMEDGSVFAEDGQSLLTFTLPVDDYYIAIRHRNHIDVMTSNVVTTGANTVVDFSSESLFGTNQSTPINGIQALVAGDATFNDVINAADRSKIWNFRNSTIYHETDVNLDGVTDAADRSLVWNNRNWVGQLP